MGMCNAECLWELVAMLGDIVKELMDMDCPASDDQAIVASWRYMKEGAWLRVHHAGDVDVGEMDVKS